MAVDQAGRSSTFKKENGLSNAPGLEGVGDAGIRKILAAGPEHPKYATVESAMRDSIAATMDEQGFNWETGSMRAPNPEMRSRAGAEGWKGDARQWLGERDLLGAVQEHLGRPRPPQERALPGTESLRGEAYDAKGQGPLFDPVARESHLGNDEASLATAEKARAEAAAAETAAREAKAQRPLFGKNETGAVRFGRARQRIRIADTGETGTVAKFNEDGSVTVDVQRTKTTATSRTSAPERITVQPEALEFLGPEPLGTPRPVQQKGASITNEQAPLPTDPAEKLVALIKRGKNAVKQTERLRHPERVKRANELDRIFGQQGGETGFHEGLRSLKGELPRADLLRDQGFGQADVDGLFQRIQGLNDLTPFERLDAQKGLAKLLDPTATNPERSELALLEGIFGQHFVDTVRGASKFSMFMRSLNDVANVPRALAASFDMSAPLRQGLVLTASHPVKAAKAFAEMHRYFFSSKRYEGFREALRADALLPLAQESGLHLASLSGGAGKSLARAGRLGGGEEVFRSLTAENIPILGHGVKASERAYMGYLDKLRMDVFKDSVRRFEARGMTPESHPEVYTGLAKWINISTGRGSLGKWGERIAEPLGQTFFSPRFIAARLQTLNPFTYGNLPKPVRMQAMRELASTAAVGLSLIGLAKAAAGDKADIELDPRSTDFGKVRVGHVRFDPWGGFQPYIRFAAQIAGGPGFYAEKAKDAQGKTLKDPYGRPIQEDHRLWEVGARKTLSGELKPFQPGNFGGESRGSQLLRFGRMKLSPQARVVADMLFGSDAVGGPNKWSVDFQQAPGQVASEIPQTKEWSLFVPMVIQDTVEALQKEGVASAGAAAPISFYGGTVNSYDTPEEALARSRKHARSVFDTAQELDTELERRHAR